MTRSPEAIAAAVAALERDLERFGPDEGDMNARQTAHIIAELIDKRLETTVQSAVAGWPIEDLAALYLAWEVQRVRRAELARGLDRGNKLAQ